MGGLAVEQACTVDKLCVIFRRFIICLNHPATVRLTDKSCFRAAHRDLGGWELSIWAAVWKKYFA
jgi:hypothetical protein